MFESIMSNELNMLPRQRAFVDIKHLRGYFLKDYRKITETLEIRHLAILNK